MPTMSFLDLSAVTPTLNLSSDNEPVTLFSSLDKFLRAEQGLMAYSYILYYF
jgi:hypothetical protein